MSLQRIRDWLEARQVQVYFSAVGAAAAFALTAPHAPVLEVAINPALAFMLFVTFVQTPIDGLWRAFNCWRFTAPLLAANFLAIPLFVAALVQFLPPEPLIQIGVLLVLLTPCIDYVVTFAHLGRGDAKLLLAATPALLMLQMALLPLYLAILLGEEAAQLVQVGPFLGAFFWLIVLPLMLAGFFQLAASRTAYGTRAASLLGILPVPATALVLFVVVAAFLPQLAQARNAVLTVAPVYIAFAVFAPLIGWAVARLTGLQGTQARSVAFSTATRNSLVVLPVALAVPGAIPVLPAIIVAQTLVELVSELVYIRFLPRLGRTASP